MASAIAKAETIIAVDIDADKLETALQFGATHTLLADVDTPHKIFQICGSGVDFAFECSGSPKAREQVIHSIQTGWGVAVMIGLSPQSAVISIPPNVIIGQGKTVRGTVFGGWKNPKEALTKLADSFTKNSVPDIQGLISSEIKLKDVGSALQTLIKSNKHCRILIRF
ncbi:alcohol dehydrogenase class-3 [Eurytemora carolleeae]|uniref:alcohol dehydrogenase class-3 n=1 Tax=Eurytemora carolleeae TaxID=1294199 RepID=UPI000C78840F|nr:alcohol dehydrogenase class-3 [Eurytemora carolleeae]|eukprot:XP_023346176.1 alcohol dehydrogenase class-3-like [Eurytemora affinis]